MAPAVPSPDSLETVACDYCGHGEADLLFGRAAGDEATELPIVRCTRCGLCYLKKRLRPDALKALYGEHYFNSDDSGSKGYDHYLSDRPEILKTFGRRLGLIEKLRRGHVGRVLDVGCAAGFFLEAAKSRGWDAEGIEISEYAANVARKRGLSVASGEFLPCSKGLESGSFDAITMWDYIEHVREPGAEIRRVSELLVPGGIFALATPDVGSLPARIFRSRWMGIKPEEHLYYFDRPSILRYLEDHGMRAEVVRSTGKYVSLQFFAQRVGFYSQWLEKVISLGLRATGLGPRTLYVNPFDIMIVVARKSP